METSGKSMDWFLYENGLRHERVKLNKKCVCPSFLHDHCFTVLVILDESFSPQFIVNNKHWK